MTTTLAPALGHGPLTQQGTGATPGFDAIDDRRLMSDPDLGEGVTTYGSFRASQRGAGANMSVDINMDDAAYVRGDAVSLQGLYKLAPHASTINEVIATADATNPRIDRVILEIKDTQHDASGSSLAQTRVITGTATGGATLDNLTGAGAVPSSALLLADVLVAAGASSVTNANIRDRRAFNAGAIPPLLTAVDMVPLIPIGVTAAASLGGTGVVALADLEQAAFLVQIPRRIVGATRIRWRYQQDATTAVTGSYVFSLFDSTGRTIVDTGSVAFTGATSSVQTRSETITATTFEPGLYYAFMGCDFTNSGLFGFIGPYAQTSKVGSNPVASSPAGPNIVLRSASGGVTVPKTLLSFLDIGAQTSFMSSALPMMALSVG